MNDPVLSQLHATARHLLSTARVDLVLGFQRGTLPLRSRPAFIRQPEEVQRLLCDAFAESNLARYLLQQRGQRTAIVARGCEARSIATLVAERQVDREEIVILGFPCRGVIDRRRLLAAAPGEILVAEDQGEEIVIRGRGFEERLPRADLLSRACQACTEPNPATADILLGEPLAGWAPRRDLVAEVEALPPAERWAAFAAQAARCIRCYACRQACPLCYCPECFVDRNQPAWTDAGPSPAGQQFWQIMRAYHQAGRCASCGACERACPLGIPLLHLTDKLTRVVHSRFGPGATLELDAETRGAGSRPQEER